MAALQWSGSLVNMKSCSGWQLCCLRNRCGDRVARARHGLDHLRVEARIKLSAQAMNMHIDNIAAWFEVIIPRRLEQHRAGDDLAGVPH